VDPGISAEVAYREKILVRKGGLEPPPAKADKILSPELSLLITIGYSTEQHSTTRNEGTYKRPGSPRSVVSCCRKLAFVEFKCTRSAPWRRPSVGAVLLQERLEARVVAEGVPHGMIPDKTRVNSRGHRGADGADGGHNRRDLAARRRPEDTKGDRR